MSATVTYEELRAGEIGECVSAPAGMRLVSALACGHTARIWMENAQHVEARLSGHLPTACWTVLASGLTREDASRFFRATLAWDMRRGSVHPKEVALRLGRLRQAERDLAAAQAQVDALDSETPE